MKWLLTLNLSSFNVRLVGENNRRGLKNVQHIAELFKSGLCEEKSRVWRHICYNNYGNFICVFECTIVNLATNRQFTNAA